MLRLGSILGVLLLTSASTGAIAQDGELSTDRELASYALGIQVALQLRQQGLDLDPRAVGIAISDVFENGSPRFSADQLQAAVVNYQEALLAERAREGEENLKAAIEFLDANRAAEGVIETESGLQYKVLASGEGASPAPGDTVVVHYRGSLLDGTEFDSSYQRGQPATLQTDQVIPGWQEALVIMKPGDKWTLYLPPELGYGERGSGGTIGPNSAMIFEVYLVEVQ